MFSQALALYRRRFWAVVLTAALAILPANLLMLGALRFGVTRLGGTGIADTGTRAEQVREKKRDQEEKLPSPEEQPERARQVTREALQAGSKSPPAETKSASPLLSAILPIAYAVVVTAGILLLGLALAQATLVPLVLGRTHRPAGACAAVASRFGPLLWTGLLAGGLVAVGSLFFLVPGIVLALGVSFAVPATMEEGISGRAALARSWELMRDCWGQVLLMWLLIIVLTALATAAALLTPPGLWRPFVSGLVRVIGYPLPLLGLVLLYQKASAQRAQTTSK
jgi:uncharacterized membrane protein